MLRQRVPLLAVVLLLALSALYAEAGRGSGGTYSLPTGNPVTTGTTITSTWANGTLSDIATELTYSLDRQGRGGMLAALALTNGTSSSPAATFTSEPNSGIYRAAASDIRMCVNATDVLRLQTSGVSTYVPLSVAGRTTTSYLTVTGNADSTSFISTSSGVAAVGALGLGTGAGVYATGGATGAGIYGLGGSTSGAGGVFLGTGSDYGIRAYGGASAGPGAFLSGGLNAVGAFIQAGTGSATGANITGSGSGAAIAATGGSSAGAGATLTGGNGGVGANVFGGAGGPGLNVSAGSGNGYGASISGSGTGLGLQAAAGTASTSSARTDAVVITNGDINMDGIAVPNQTLGLKNRVTPVSFAKAFGAFSIGASSAISQTAGMNVASLTAGGSSPCGGTPNIVTITFAQPFANANYVAALSGGINGCRPVIFSQSASALQVEFANGQTICGQGCSTSPTNLDWNGAQATFVIFGAQ